MLIERFASSGHTCLPVQSESGELVGVISFQTVQHTLSQRAALANLIVARDLATPAITVTGEQSLYSALAKMSRFGSKDLLVVEAADSAQNVLAVLTSGDINAIYDEEILNPPKAEAREPVLARTLGRWFPRRGSSKAKDKEATPSA